MNRLVFSHWDQIRAEQALSKSVLRRYIGYWHTHKALVDREAIGVHGGTYAEELIATIVRARVLKDLGKTVEVQQNRWDKTAKREADICFMRGERSVAIIELKSALTKEEWKKTRQTKEDYQKLPNPPSYWLISMRADGLDDVLQKTVNDDFSCCVLSRHGRKVFSLPEQPMEIWKPLEDWLDALMATFFC